MTHIYSFLHFNLITPTTFVRRFNYNLRIVEMFRYLVTAVENSCNKQL